MDITQNAANDDQFEQGSIRTNPGNVRYGFTVTIRIAIAEPPASDLAAAIERLQHHYEAIRREIREQCFELSRGLLVANDYPESPDGPGIGISFTVCPTAIQPDHRPQT